MKRLLALTWKEFLQLKRDKMTLRMIVLVPVMQTLVFGYAINYDVKHLKTVVLDESRSYESRELVARMTGTDYFDVVKSVDSMDAIRTELDSGKASVGLVFDRDFGKNRHRGQPSEAFLIVNASDTTTTRGPPGASRSANGIWSKPSTYSPRSSKPSAACPTAIASKGDRYCPCCMATTRVPGATS